MMRWRSLVGVLSILVIGCGSDGTSSLDVASDGGAGSSGGSGADASAGSSGSSGSSGAAVASACSAGEARVSFSFPLTTAKAGSARLEPLVGSQIEGSGCVRLGADFEPSPDRFRASFTSARIAFTSGGLPDELKTAFDDASLGGLTLTYSELDDVARAILGLVTPQVGPSGSLPSWEILTYDPCVLSNPRNASGEVVPQTFTCSTMLLLGRYEEGHVPTDEGFGKGTISMTL